MDMMLTDYQQAASSVAFLSSVPHSSTSYCVTTCDIPSWDTEVSVEQLWNGDFNTSLTRGHSELNPRLHGKIRLGYGKAKTEKRP